MEARMPRPQRTGAKSEISSPIQTGRLREASYPRLLNLHIVRHVLDQFVNCRLVLLISSETRDVQEIDDRLLLQQRRVRYRLS